MKPFEKWKYSELQKTFGIHRVKTHPLLTQWLAADEPISQVEKNLLAKHSERLLENADAWQEDELKMLFIAPILDMVDFYHYGQYKTFTQRLIESKLTEVGGKEIELKGRVELVVATGVQDPDAPFFFLHEYKPQTGGNNDPLGQLLAAMLVAQAKNPVEMPLHGVFIIGRQWFFVVLIGKDYAVSNSLNASNGDIYQIMAMLKARKKEIEATITSGTK